MLLKGKNGNEIELSFVRDALPESQDGYGDDAWCTVIVRAATQDDEWEESSPCINFFEFTNLAEWLEALGNAQDATGSPEENEIELLEPELKFSVSQNRADAVGIRVSFHLEDRPEEFAVDSATDAAFVDVYVERQNLLSAAGALRAALDDLRRTAAGDNKDDIRGEDTPGIMGLPSEDLNVIDRESRTPPGAGRGEDNAGER
ncbi:MAG: hypothetical protein SFZ23_16335 [Planctomycetota bacterium]|nr:hypothetical protein [Planctomycetota bacterium]